MDPRSIRALAVLGAMYVAQGVVYGFAAYVLLPRLAAAGVSLEAQTGIVALAGVPWVFKLAWGPVLDRFGTRVRGFATAAMLAIGACLLGLSTIPRLDAEVGTVALVWLVLNVALSLQDAATDAMALDGIAPERRGLANGVMLGGHHVGLDAVGGLALGAVAAAHGVSSALAVQGALVLVLAWAPRAMPRREAAPRPRLTLADVRAALRGRGMLVGVAAIVFAADVITGALASEFWTNRLDWSPERVAETLPPVILVATVGGYAIAAAVADRIGHLGAAMVGTIGLGTAWLGFALLEPAWADERFMLGFVVVQALPTALLYVGVHALLMDRTEPRVRATHFAVLTALLNLPRVVAPTAAPTLLAWLGWPGLFAACGAFQVALVLPLRRLGRR